MCGSGDANAARRASTLPTTHDSPPIIFRIARPTSRPSFVHPEGDPDVDHDPPPHRRPSRARRARARLHRPARGRAAAARAAGARGRREPGAPAAHVHARRRPVAEAVSGAAPRRRAQVGAARGTHREQRDVRGRLRDRPPRLRDGRRRARHDARRVPPARRRRDDPLRGRAGVARTAARRRHRARHLQRVARRRRAVARRRAAGGVPGGGARAHDATRATGSWTAVVAHVEGTGERERPAARRARHRVPVAGVARAAAHPGGRDAHAIRRSRASSASRPRRARWRVPARAIASPCSSPAIASCAATEGSAAIAGESRARRRCSRARDRSACNFSPRRVVRAYIRTVAGPGRPRSGR